MRKSLRIVLALAIVSIAAMAPAGADPASQRDLLKCDPNTVTCDGLLAQAPQRYVPHPVGVPVDLHYLFGPYLIPPGQDSNRITVDIPIETGFIVAVAPDLVDGQGRIPTQQEAHIHHAHWFRLTNDPQYDYYPGLNYGGMGASWVFGTGEEKTQGRLDDRALLEAANNDGNETNDFTYGIPVDGSSPQAMIYMIHNKLSTPGNYFVVLDVTFIPGTRDQIKAATGKDVHPLYEQLWGQTKDVTDTSSGIGARWTVSHNGTAIAMGSHIHPGGKAVVVSNLGPMVNGHPLCQGIDPDHDGYDGVALLDSYKFDRDMRVWPYSENYQMGATKYGWRAPLHAGDILEQKATYAVNPMSNPTPFDLGSKDLFSHNWYQAMSYTGIYYDREQLPASSATTCDMATFAPHLIGTDSYAVQNRSASWVPAAGETQASFDARVGEVEDMFNHFLPANATAEQHAVQGMVNHPWKVREPICAQPGLVLADLPTCGPTDIATQTGPEVTQIHVAGFRFAPGDLDASLGDPIIPQVRQGSTVQLINDDAALNVRHTFTSCQWPCIGPYRSNFPLPDGGPTAFDSGKLGNVDPVDGGLFNAGSDLPYFLGGGQSDTVPVYNMVVNLPVGKYSYFCRIHPFMRGAFEVIASDA